MLVSHYFVQNFYVHLAEIIFFFFYQFTTQLPSLFYSPFLLPPPPHRLFHHHNSSTNPISIYRPPQLKLPSINPKLPRTLSSPLHLPQTADVKHHLLISSQTSHPFHLSRHILHVLSSTAKRQIRPSVI